MHFEYNQLILAFVWLCGSGKTGEWGRGGGVTFPSFDLEIGSCCSRWENLLLAEWPVALTTPSQAEEKTGATLSPNKTFIQAKMVACCTFCCKLWADWLTKYSLLLWRLTSCSPGFKARACVIADGLHPRHTHRNGRKYNLQNIAHCWEENTLYRNRSEMQ